MSHFKSPDNGIHFLDDDSFAYLLPPGSVQITDEGADAIRAEKNAPTQDQIIALITAQIQDRLDAFARTRNYDNILSACTYATSTVPKFAAEGQYCVDARDATWSAAYEMLTEVEQGTRPVPSSIADIEAELPALEWPQ